MPYKEKEITKRYYTISEVADKLGVATSLIRFWETEFDVIQPTKNKKGNRQFTLEDIKKVKMIYHLVKEKGYTLSGAKKFIKSNPNVTMDKTDLIQSLKVLRSFLEELRNEVKNFN